MAFLDRFRAKPEWQHLDPLVRAAAVRRLGAEDRGLVETLFRQDPDPRVRRAALHRLADAVLAATVASDADAGLREEASEILLRTALQDKDVAAAEAALGALKEARHLATVVRDAASEGIRSTALGRIEDPRALATLARTSGHPGTRLGALERIAEPALLAEVALKSEHKDVALAALDRVVDPEALQAIAARGRHRSATRRAGARLEAAQAAAREATAPPPEDLEARRAREAAEDERQGELLKQADEQTRLGVEARAARVALCEAVEALAGTEDDVLARLEEAHTSWASLPPFAGSESDELAERFRRAGEGCGERRRAWTALRALRIQLEDLITLAAPLAEAADLENAVRQWRELQQRWKALSPTAGADPELEQRFAQPGARLEARQKEERDRRTREASNNLARLLNLCAQLEALAASPELSLKDADRRLKEAKKALDDPGSLPSKHDRDAVLARLEAARKAIYPRFQELRQDDEWKRWANASVQEELCGRIEALLSVPDVEDAARNLHEIETRWQDAKQAPKEQGEALWLRFKGARDQVRARVEAYFAKKAAELAENLKKKEALCEAAEALQDSTDWVKTAEALQKLQADWKQLGPTARQQSQAVWTRFRKACDHFFSRRKSDREQRTETWAANLTRKEELCVRVEALAASTDWEEASVDIRAAQAAWKQVGPVRKSRSDAIWQRFRAACDLFFDRYKRRNEIEETAKAEAREGLCLEIESLMPPAGEPAPMDLGEKVRALNAAWKQGASPAPETSSPLADRFNLARDLILLAHPRSFAGTDLDPEANRARAEKLCARVEAALIDAEGGGASLDTADLAARLKSALATNTMGGRAAVEARWGSAWTEVESAQAAWKRLGPVPGDPGRVLAERFEQACRRFQERRPAVAPAPAPQSRPRRDRPRERPTRGA